MLVLLLTHLAATVLAPVVVRWLGARGFWLLTIPNLLTVGWAVANRPAPGGVPVEHWSWIPSLGLDFSLRMDSLSWVLTLVISVIGFLVLGYCAGYFTDDEADLGRFAAHLTAFAGVMLGLVWSDDLLLLYCFWEITTVLSYLLVGHLSQRRESRTAATQALVVTTLGGLAMLVGLILIGEEANTYRLSEILAHPPTSPVVPAAVALILVGAISKSALVPFHYWLPGAMAAPTPVSAYLHAAAMVKAGVYLVARFAPAFSHLLVWQLMVLVLGGLTMLIGGYRSLRQHDLKLLLAYGTVSQLGFLIILLGAGTRNAALAGLTMLVSHAVFKAGLFLTVGAIDHATGTRDIRTLHRLGRSMPVLMVASILCAASMAGVPPLLGFVGKEAAYAALEHGPDGWSVPMLVVVIAGSVLTFAYSARFLWGAWGSCPDAHEDTRPHANAWPVTAPPVILAVAGVVLAPLIGYAEPWLESWTGLHRPSDYTAHLGLWHGVNLTLAFSLLTLALGALLFRIRGPVERLQAALPHPPAAVSGYRLMMRSLDRISLEVTGFIHRGSLPLSLAIIVGMFLLLPGGATVLALSTVTEVRLWDTPAQVAVATLIGVAAIFAARARRRFRAVFLVGATGYGCAMIFLLHGAPDLALTQVLVETVSIVIFVLVLRRFDGRFPDESLRGSRRLRTLAGIGSGLVVTAAALVAGGARMFPPDSTTLPKSAVEFGGGYNIVNVILVDIRAWDTMGELSVVLVAATGAASLVFLRSANLNPIRDRLRATRERQQSFLRSLPAARQAWLPEIEDMPGWRRSLIFEVVTRLIFHTIIVWSIYLLLVGHNEPGGGFAAGLVAGLGLAVRYLAGGAAELRAALPVMPGVLLGTGLFLSAGFGLVSMLAGGDALQSWTFDIPVPLIGNIHLVTSVFFDIGVYLVVVGLMLDVLRSLGSMLDRQIVESPTETLDESEPEPEAQGAGR